jgi:hypothetical protein
MPPLLGRHHQIGDAVSVGAQPKVFNLGVRPADGDVSEGSRTNWSTEEPPHLGNIDLENIKTMVFIVLTKIP